MNAGAITAVLNLDVSNFSSGIQSAQQQLNTFSDSSQSAGTRIQALGGTLTSYGSMLTKNVSLPLIGIGAAAVKVASDFEAAMSNVQAISNASAQDMELLSEKAKYMGATTKFSATEAANAMSYMAMAGWRTNDMLSGIDGIMNLAAASGEDLAKTSDIVTDALTGFGLSAADSSHFADVLASASSNANTNVSMLGESFKYVAPLAGAMKYSAEDTAIALGIMANSGIKASQAGTALRGAISSMLKPSENAANAMEKYGISLTDSSGNAKSLKDVMDNLRTTFGQMTEAEKSQVAATIFGTEAMSGMLAIINASDADYQKLTNSIYNADGATKQMADTMQNNLQGKVTQFKSALEGAGIAIGENLLPALTKIVEKATGVVQGFGKLNSSTQSMIVNFGLMAAAAGPVISFVGKFTTGIGSLVSGISAAVSGVGGFSSILGALISPAGAILAAVTGVGLLTAGFITLQNEMDANEVKLERAGTYFEDFSGRVRTNRNLWTKLFGEEIEIKFSSNFEEEKSAIEKGYQDLTQAWQEYYDTKNGMGESESKRRLTELTADNEEQKTILREHLDDNLGLLSDYFMKDNYMTSQQAAEQESLYIDFYNAQEKAFSDNQSRIYEIQKNAYEQKRALTTKEQEEIDSLTEQNASIMAALTTSNVDDMLSAYKAYSEASTKLMQADAEQKQLFATNVQSAYEMLNKSVHDSFAKQEEAIRNNASLTKEQQDIMINGLQKQEEALTNFNTTFGGMIQQYIDQGASLETATSSAMTKICSDLETGKIKASEFGMTNSEYMAMAIQSFIDAGAGADVLVAAIEAIPEEKRAEVLAKVEGTDKSVELEEALARLHDKNVNVNTEVNGRDDVNGLTKDIGSVPVSKNPNITVTVSGDGKVVALRNQLNSLHDVNVHVRTFYESYGDSTGKIMHGTGPKPSRLATGTENANSGLAEVAEYGPELIMSRSGASMYLATNRQIINMEGGERVFNARQTSEILRNASERNNSFNSSNIEKLLNEAITRLDKIKEATNNSSIEVTKAIENKELVSNVNLDSNSLAKGMTPTIEREQGNRMLLYKRGVLV